MRAEQGVGRPRRWPAIRAQPVHSIRRVRTTSPVAPTGQVRRLVRRRAPGPGYGWVGVGGACTHAPKRMAGPLAVAWGADHAEPWAPLVGRPATPGDAAGPALRRWDAAGCRRSTSIGWDRQCGQLTNPDAAAWQERGVAVVTLGTVVIGPRIDGAEPQGVPPGRERHGAAGESPAPAGDAPNAPGAGARVVAGPVVDAPGAVAEKR